MTRPAPTDAARTRQLVIAPFLLALMACGWLLWTRADPARQGGFCMNATVELATVFQGAADRSDPGLGLVPEPGAILEASVGIDIDRLDVATPPSVQPHVEVLRASLPAYRADRAAATAASRPAPPVPDEITGAFTSILVEYLEICR